MALKRLLSQLKTWEAEMLAVKRQSDSVVQQLAALTLELEKKNKELQHHNDDSTLGNLHRSEGFGEGGEILPRSVSLDFPYFQGDDPVEWLYKANQFFMFYNTLPRHKLRLASFHRGKSYGMVPRFRGPWCYFGLGIVC